MLADGIAPDTLGLFVGDEYAAGWSGGEALPTQIILFLGNLWDFAEADPDVFWEQIGLKCRTLLVNVFIQTHSLNADERRDFYENCIEVRDAV